MFDYNYFSDHGLIHSESGKEAIGNPDFIIYLKDTLKCNDEHIRTLRSCGDCWRQLSQRSGRKLVRETNDFLKKINEKEPME